MSERGAVGRATFDRVQQLVDSGMTRSAAFAAVAAESGRSAATVATSFYRVARQRPDGGGVKRRPRKRREAAATRPTGRGRRPNTSVDALIAEAQRAIEALGSHLRHIEKEALAARGHGDRLDKIRRALR